MADSKADAKADAKAERKAQRAAKAAAQKAAAADPERQAMIARRREAQAARKAARKALRDPETNRLPQCEPFGPFEDLIQPAALAVWGGKATEKQSAPRLVYQAEFLGPTCFYRVQVGVCKPETEREIWRVLWTGTRPKLGMTGMKKEAKAAKGKGKEKAVEEEVGGVQEQLGENGDVPPLEAVVQDVFSRRLARLAHQKASQQKALEARQRHAEYRKDAGIRASNRTPEVKITYNLGDPHRDRLPYKARNGLRHFDICGPLPDYARDAVVDGKNYIWTQDGGNVIVNHFGLDRIAKTSLGNGIAISMWRGFYDMREMETFVTKPAQSTGKRVEENAKAMSRAAAQVGGPSKRVRRNAQERIKQLDLKAAIIKRADGGWAKILNVTARERGTKAPEVHPNGNLSFEEQPHPNREDIDEVWNKRIARLRDDAAAKDYAAFLRARMEAGAVPDRATDAEIKDAEIKRGWMTVAQRRREKGQHPGDVAKRERAEEKRKQAEDRQEEIEAAERQKDFAAADRRAERQAATHNRKQSKATSQPQPHAGQPASYGQSSRSPREERHSRVAERRSPWAQLDQAGSETENRPKPCSWQQQQGGVAPAEDRRAQEANPKPQTRRSPAEGGNKKPAAQEDQGGERPLVRRAFAQEPREWAKRDGVRGNMELAAEKKRRAGMAWRGASSRSPPRRRLDRAQVKAAGRWSR